MPGALSRVRAVPRTVARVYRRTPLRVTLVATVLVLVLAALVGTGFAVRTTMNHYLVSRLDKQLETAVDPIAQHSRRGDGHGDRGGGPDELPSAYIVAELRADGSTYSAPTGDNLVDPGQPLPAFPRRTLAQTSAAGTSLFTVGAVRGDGQWRVLARTTTLPDGSSGTLLVAQSLADVQNTVDQLTVVLLVIGAAALVIIAGVGYLVVRASLRPLREVEHTAAEIAAGDLTHRVPEADPRTEVGQLAGALNTMLGRIETAFAERSASERAAKSSEDRMRSFVADASHELRTPLTTIRGFAELYRHGAADGPDDLARFMSRIESEAIRMGLLVEDLLLLARLDQQRPLKQELVDVLALASDAVLDARVVDPVRPIRIEVGSTDPPPLVVGDDARLRQVLGNLVANALKYTPAASPVTIGVSTVPGDAWAAPTVVLTVADEGPGLTPDVADRIFERFYRVDAARSRDDGGTGLGLAIVAALVTAHGGRVGVDTAPGAGARFRVELPLAGSTRSLPAGQHADIGT